MTQQQQWKDILREIRLLFGTVEAQVGLAMISDQDSLTHHYNWFEFKGFPKFVRLAPVLGLSALQGCGVPVPVTFG